MSALAATYPVALYSIREMLRRKLLYVWLGIGVAASLVFGIVPLFLPGNPSRPERVLFVLNSLSAVAGLVSTLTAMTIAMTVVHNDLESGVAVSIFSKPVDRAAYAAGKLLAAAGALALVMAVLGLGVQIVLALNGSPHTGAVVSYFLTDFANNLSLMLVVMVLTVVVNNIVAAVIGFLVLQVASIVGTGYLYAVNGAIPVGWVTTLLEVAYWILPRRLTGNLQQEILKASYAAHPPPPNARGGGGFNASGDIVINGHAVSLASGWPDAVAWLVYALLLWSALYVLLRRREV